MEVIALSFYMECSSKVNQGFESHPTDGSDLK